MKFALPVEEGLFLRRYKRFFADIDLSGETLVAHVANTGSMKGLLAENVPCRFTTTDDPKRKLKHTLQMIKTPTSWVGVNTHLSNDLVWEAFQNSEVPHWKKFKCGRREVKVNDKTRFDLVLWKDPSAADPDKKIDPQIFNQEGGPLFHFVEVKNVTLAEGDEALFPDAVTTRGQKHIRELMELLDKGHSVELLFTIQRTDCKSFSPADSIDPEYGKLLREAKKKGLRITPYPCIFTKNSIKLNAEDPLKLILS